MGFGGYGGETSPGSYHYTPFRRRNDHRPSSHIERDIYPHARPPMLVSDYMKEAAARAWLLPQHNWQNAGNPISEHQILYADPWRPGLAQWPIGHTPRATGTTECFAQCWKFNKDNEGKGIWEKLSAPIPPEGLILFLVVSGVTWWFAEQNRCSTSLVARIEGIINHDSHERFMMEVAGKLLTDVSAWLTKTAA
jgi:hypothetical protein